jgi:PAS domain S-box-containing protein
MSVSTAPSEIPAAPAADGVRQEGLYASEARFRAFVEASPAAILLFRQDFRCVDCNSAAAALCGVERPSDLFGKTPVQFAPARQPDGRTSAETMAALVGRVQREGLVTFEWEIQAPDGRTLFSEVRLAPLVLGGEELIQCVSVDITERKLAEREIARLQAQLVQTQKLESLGNLVGGLAHDMNNVLGAILGVASANLELQPAGSRARLAFETITRAAERGGKTVKGLLNFARTHPAQEQELDFNAMLREAVGLLEHTTLAKVRLVLELEPGLRTILGDGGALSSAIMNLCLNAVDAMADGGQLSLRTRNLDDGQIEVLVRDSGCGMTPAILQQAMDPYFTTKPAGQGTGLGLSLVYSTVRAHQGQMELESEPGRGTCVRLRFPARRAAGSATAAGSGAGARQPHRALDVLLVDDDPLIRDAMDEVMAILGHRPVIVPGGGEALQRLQGGYRPDVIILDLNMPGLGGAGTLERLRAPGAPGAGTPVVLATGRADQAAMDLAQAHRDVTLLAKPFTMKELGALLERIAAR